MLREHWLRHKSSCGAEILPIINERQKLGIVRSQRKLKKFHARSLRHAIRLKLIATPTGCHNLLSTVLAATRFWQHMVAGQLSNDRPVATIHAGMNIARKQGGVTQPMKLPGRGQSIAATGNNSRQTLYRLLPIESTNAAAGFADDISEGPYRQISGVKTRCLLPRKPFNRLVG